MAAASLHPPPLLLWNNQARLSRRSSSRRCGFVSRVVLDACPKQLANAEHPNGQCTIWLAEDPWSADFQASYQTVEHFCTVKLVLQLSTSSREQPYVIPKLGQWNALTPLPLQPSHHHNDFWQVDFEVPVGSTLEYTYFLQDVGDHSSPPLSWRQNSKKLLVPPRSSLHVNDCWTERNDRFGAEDPFMAVLEARMLPCTSSGDENPFLAYAELVLACKEEAEKESPSPSRLHTSDFRFFPKRKVFPREEPWLLESIFLGEAQEQTPSKARDVAVEIFINSSECTMQRIAIVENKKLVQLLLEPVNSNFQVGNVYLGVVKQLLPGMNGVFVDIGSSRTALLEVNMYQHPHVFHAAKDADLDAQVLHDEQTSLLRANVRRQTTPKPTTLIRKIAAWRRLRKGSMMIVQVKKEALRQKGPQLTATVALAGRFWVVIPQVSNIGVARKITGLERSRLKQLAKELQPAGFGLTVRSEAMGRGREELEKDLARLVDTWNNILARAEIAAAAGGKDPLPVLLQRAMGQTLRTVRDVFNNEVERFVVDSPQTYQEVTGYLQEVAPHLCDRVELYTGGQPIFDAFHLEEEIQKSSSKRVDLPNGAYLVLEETEALVSIDVNGGVGMLGDATSQRDAILKVNLAAARQIATELRLRDIGGIIVVDFIDMEDPVHERLVFEEMRKAIERDRSKVAISEISEFGLMEMTRARDRPSVTSRVTDSCSCCGGTGRIESVEMTLSKVERAIKRILCHRNYSSSESTKWPSMFLRLDPVTHEYLKTRGRRRLNQLCSALNVLLTLKVVPDLPRGEFQVIEFPLNETKVVNGSAPSKLASRRVKASKS